MTHDLVRHTETMQQDLETLDNIDTLFAEAGLNTSRRDFEEKFKDRNMSSRDNALMNKRRVWASEMWNEVYTYLDKNLPANKSAGLAYTRTSQTGHMIVVQKKLVHYMLWIIRKRIWFRKS